MPITIGAMIDVSVNHLFLKKCEELGVKKGPLAGVAIRWFLEQTDKDIYEAAQRFMNNAKIRELAQKRLKLKKEIVDIEEQLKKAGHPVKEA